ncbi:MAG TPA: hypothetical protein PLT25_06070 [Acidocella sp.]|nr:hypothetical protein [Acidocella sp.]
MLQSYNLPAVKLIQTVGPLAVVATLRHAGAVVQLPPGDNHPSLAIALGGAGVRLSGVCALYAALAPGSPHLRLGLSTAAPAQPQPAVMSVSSAQEILAILEGLPPPVGTAGFAGRAVAYKTDTSYGYRDAWSFGVSADWTVGVWVGRAEGTPRPGAFGLNTAAPLLADIFALLPPDATQLPVPMTVLPNEADANAPVALQATGGTGPYRWVVDGKELQPPLVGAPPPSWQPSSAGFFHITVIDAHHQSTSESLHVR